MASVKRMASVPYCWFSATGSMPCPWIWTSSAFGIAHDRVQVHFAEGTWPMNLSPIMIIRATQKNRISYPVMSRLVG